MSAIFLFDNQADDATITASTETLPASNVQNLQRSRVWRSDLGVMSSLELELNSVSGVNYVALIDTNLSTSGLIHIEAWDDGFDGAVQTVDETVSPTLYAISSNSSPAYGLGPYGIGPYGQNQALASNTIRNITIVPVPSSISTFWRITFADVNTDYQQLGRLYLSSGFQLTYNLSYNWRAERVERSVTKEAISGATYSQLRDSRLQLVANFDFVTDNERTQVLLRMQQFGNTTPFVFSIFPENDLNGLTTTVYGRFTEKSIQHANKNINQFSITVLEEL